jgi:phosphatidylinositol glycan class N
MSTLLGLDLPVNSVGVLPDVDVSRPGYLALRERDVAHAAVANAKVRLVGPVEG